MKGRYRKISVKIWVDKKFNQLDDTQQLLFFRILTHPNMTGLGAIRATLAGLAEEAHWPEKKLRAAFQGLESVGVVIRDPDSNLIVIPNFIRHNAPESPKVVLSWAKLGDFLPECDLFTEHIKATGEQMAEMGQGFFEAYRIALREAFPIAYRVAYGEAMPYPKSENRNPKSERNIPPPPLGENPADAGERDSQSLEELCSNPEQPEEPTPDLDADTPAEPKPPENPDPPGFAEFWAAYPRKEKRVAAVKAWKKIPKARDLLPLMLATIAEWRESEQWRKGFIPHPATWLNGGQWDDAPPIKGRAKPHESGPNLEGKEPVAW